jgi:hypothetical protein
MQCHDNAALRAQVELMFGNPMPSILKPRVESIRVFAAWLGAFYPILTGDVALRVHQYSHDTGSVG